MQASSEGEQHPDLRKKPKPEFDGEINPKTGEVGGPKNEPLTHGKSLLLASVTFAVLGADLIDPGLAGDWTYGGRCTDF